MQPQHDGSAPRGTPLNLGQKSPTPCWFERRRHSIANCGRMVTDRATVQWRSYRKLPSLFLMVPSLTFYDLPFPPTWGLVLGKGFRGRRIERRYLRFEQIQDGGRRHLGKISNGHISATGRISPQRLTIFLYSAHREVIFAIAQLSCCISSRRSSLL